MWPPHSQLTLTHGFDVDMNPVLFNGMKPQISQA